MTYDQIIDNSGNTSTVAVYDALESAYNQSVGIAAVTMDRDHPIQEYKRLPEEIASHYLVDAAITAVHSLKPPTTHSKN